MSETFANYMPGDRAYFQPVRNRIDWDREAARYTTDDTAIPVLVVGSKVTSGKVLYDIALPTGDGDFYEALPLCNVDSIYLAARPRADA